jgi:hypothetical protein
MAGMPQVSTLRNQRNQARMALLCLFGYSDRAAYRLFHAISASWRKGIPFETYVRLIPTMRPGRPRSQCRCYDDYERRAPQRFNAYALTPNALTPNAFIDNFRREQSYRTTG